MVSVKIVRKKASLKRRYLAKLCGNFTSIVISLVISSIVPRALGPKTYGDFSFLSNFFLRIVGFLEMGTSSAFFTKLSKRQNEFGLVYFYIFFSAILSVLLLIILKLTIEIGISEKIWPKQELLYIYMAAIYGILTWKVQILNKMADAYGITVSSEVVIAIQKGFGLIVISFLFLSSKLTLYNFFFITTLL